jgi:hypothetical protein
VLEGISNTGFMFDEMGFVLYGFYAKNKHGREVYWDKKTLK